MISEEIILERDRVECIVRELSAMLQIESHYQFKLRFISNAHGCKVLTIIPHSQAVDITINK